MSRRFLQRGAVLLCMLTGLGLLMARRNVSSSAGSLSVKNAEDVRQTDNSSKRGVVVRPRTFSRAYDYCYTDENGRPMVVHRKRLVFFLPDSPPEVNDRTFIESRECQSSVRPD